VDVSRARRAAGVALVAVAGWLVGVDVAAVAAGGVAAVALTITDRGTPGLAAASLVLAAAGVLVAEAVAGVPTVPFVITTLSVAVGVAAGVRAAVRGRAGGLVAAWSAAALALAAALSPLAARHDPVASLLGARLATAPVTWVVLLAPFPVAAAAGGLAVDRWLTADLPPRPATAGPPAAVLLLGLVAGPGLPDPGAALAGTAVVGLAVLTWAATVAVVASAVAAAAAAEDHRFRRPTAWLAAASGPVALLAASPFAGGVFVDAFVAAVPGGAVAVGATVGTVVAALVGLTVVAVLGTCAAAPTLSPRVRRLLEGRAAEVAGAGLLLAAGTKPPRGHGVVVVGGVAVLAWLLLADRAHLAPPPRTDLARTGTVALAAAVGTVFAARAYRVVPRLESSLGGLLLLAGVTVLGVAIAR
jgi:hypothetical protein